jgi:hypothetical protein
VEANKKYNGRDVVGLWNFITDEKMDKVITGKNWRQVWWVVKHYNGCKTDDTWKKV